jgi:hypothetical protein
MNGWWCWVTVTVLLAGCARAENEKAPATAAPPPTAAAAPAAEPAPAPAVANKPASADDLQTLESAEAALERARSELDQATVAFYDTRDRGSNADEERAPGSARASGAAAPAKRETRRQAGSGAVASAPKAAEKAAPSDAAALSEEGNACETACKAWASLLRAKDAICRLDSPTGARCSRAQGVVRDAESRVSVCNCK